MIQIGKKEKVYDAIRTGKIDAAELGWNLWDNERGMEEELFSESVMRKLLAKYTSEGWVAFYNQYVQKYLMHKFKRQIAYKCELCGIEVVYADQFYPSTKTCSKCGNIKKDLKLSDRVYHCDCYGLTIDRDFNVSLNLANYESA